MHIIFKAASGGLTPYLIQYHPLHHFMLNSLFSGSEFGHFHLLPLYVIHVLLFFSEPPSCTGLLNHLAPRQLVCIMIFILMMSLPGPPSSAIFSANPGCKGWHQKFTILFQRIFFRMAQTPLPLCYPKWDNVWFYVILSLMSRNSPPPILKTLK